MRRRNKQGCLPPRGRWPRPRPRPDEGRVCRNYPFTRCIGKLCPHQSAYADSFSLRAKSRLRRLRFDTRLRAPPEVEALETQKRGRFRALFFIYRYPYLFLPLTTNPPVHTSAMASAATTASQMPSTPMMSGRVRMDTTWNSSVRRKEMAADTAPLSSAVKNAEPKM